MNINFLSEYNLIKEINYFFLNSIKSKHYYISIGLMGGSTAKKIYSLLLNNKDFIANDLQKIIWSVSDERYVPISDKESNFGNANSFFLEPLGIKELNKFPWKITGNIHQDVIKHEKNWINRLNNNYSFDVCFLGIGLDGHIASIFPDSILLNQHAINKSIFSAVHVPNKSWRLTITLEGLIKAKHIVVVVLDINKKSIIHKVLYNQINIKKYPAQFLRTLGNKVTWIIDDKLR